MWSPLRAYSVAIEAYPLLTKSITSSILTSFADIVSQLIERRRAYNDDKITHDYKRTLRFGLFGLILQAPWNHYWYLLLDLWIPVAGPFTYTTLVKVLLDQFVQAPILTLLIYLFLGILEGKTLQKIQSLIKSSFINTMKKNWIIWIPATFINLAFIANQYRVLYINCVFFFWSIYLSMVINNVDDGVKGCDDGIEEGALDTHYKKLDDVVDVEKEI